MNRRFFIQALAAGLGFFGLDKLVKAEEKVVKYSRFFRRIDQAIMDEFKGIQCLDERSLHKVPIIWATEDQAAAYTTSPDGCTIRLPLLNIYRGDMFFNDKIHVYYHMTAQTLFTEDMNQITEQVISKFHPNFTNAVGKYSLLTTVNNNYPSAKYAEGWWDIYEPEFRVRKQQFNMLVTLEGKP